MKLRLLALLLFAASVSAMAQPAQGPVVYQNYTATGTCILPNFLTVVTSGAGAGVYQCKGSPLTWQLIGGSSTAFITSLTTLGSSGAASVTSGILNIPNYAVSGGLSGQTINCVPLAASTTTSTTSSTVCQRAGGQIVVGSATNVAPSQDPTFEVRRIVGGVISHGVSVDDVLSGGTNPYAAFDSRLEITGGFNIDHYAGYQDIPTVDVGYTGTLTNLINFVGYANINGGTVTNRFGYEVNDVVKTGGATLGTQYGVFINSLTQAGVNHGIFVATNDVFFGGGAEIAGAPLKVDNASAAGSVLVGPWGTVATYNALSLNGSLSAVQGLVGGNGGDPNLYLFIPGGSLEFGVMSKIDIDVATTLTWTGDVGLSRDSAGVLDVGNGTAGNKSGTVRLTSLLASGTVDGTAPVTITTGTTATLGGTFKSGYTFNQEATAATAVAYTLPTAAVGLQYCVGNSWNGSAATTGTLTVNTSASGQFIIFTDGTLSATGGNVTSGGASADFACFVGTDATHWYFKPSSGTWSKH